MTSHPFLLYLVLAFLPVCQNAIEVLPKIQVVKELSDNIMRNYSKHILPSERLPFNISIEIIPLSLGEINEIEEMMSFVFWLGYQWNDESIKWDRNATNVASITLGWNDVWTPVFRVANPHAEVSKIQNVDRSYDAVRYASSGTAYFYELMTTRTTCDFDMTYYPFDIQACSIEMFVVGHMKFPFKLMVDFTENKKYNDKDHGSWALISQTATSHYGTLTIELMFKRRPLFLLINIFLPLIILALLTPVVFVLPKKSGERVSYSITMLLAISVYMIIVSEYLPQNSQPMPLISIMIFICYILDALIVFIVIINTKIYALNDKSHVPNVCNKFVLITRKISSIVNCENFNSSYDDDSEDQDKDFGSETLMELEEDNAINSFGSEKPKETVDITWKDVSNAIDKWCFMISYTCKFIIPMVFLSVCKANNRKELVGN